MSNDSSTAKTDRCAFTHNWIGVSGMGEKTRKVCRRCGTVVLID